MALLRFQKLVGRTHPSVVNLLQLQSNKVRICGDPADCAADFPLYTEEVKSIVKMPKISYICGRQSDADQEGKSANH